METQSEYAGATNNIQFTQDSIGRLDRHDSIGKHLIGKNKKMRSRLHNLHERLARRWWRDDGAQMVEFAVTLPLLVVFVVGIFDFSNAFTLKQKLTNVTRDAARVAAADPASDVPSSANTVPSSVSDAYQLIANYFTANQLNMCGITATSATPSSPAIWTYTGTTGCSAPGVTIIINRGYYFPQSVTTQPAPATCVTGALGGQTAEIGTCVTIKYPYQWKFGKVAGLLGSSPTLPTSIAATAVAMNEN
jgi:Flp pilus assembly protein TadG